MASRDAPMCEVIRFCNFFRTRGSVWTLTVSRSVLIGLIWITFSPSALVRAGDTAVSNDLLNSCFQKQIGSGVADPAESTGLHVVSNSMPKRLVVDPRTIDGRLNPTTTEASNQAEDYRSRSSSGNDGLLQRLRLAAPLSQHFQDLATPRPAWLPGVVVERASLESQLRKIAIAADRELGKGAVHQHGLDLALTAMVESGDFEHAASPGQDVLSDTVLSGPTDIAATHATDILASVSSDGITTEMAIEAYLHFVAQQLYIALNGAPQAASPLEQLANWYLVNEAPTMVHGQRIARTLSEVAHRCRQSGLGADDSSKKVSSTADREAAMSTSFPTEEMKALFCQGMIVDPESSSSKLRVVTPASGKER